MFTHPYSKYGLALVMLEEELDSFDEITHQMLKKHLIVGLGHYRIEPVDTLSNNGQIKFDYVKYEEIEQRDLQSSGNPKQGVYLTPNFITTDRQARYIWNKSASLIKHLDKGKKLTKKIDVTKAIAPVANKFNTGKNLTFKYSKVTFLEACLCAITTTTPYKPSLAFKTTENGQNSYTPQAVIPDLSVKELVKFIELFKMMLQSRTEKLMQGNIREDEKGNRTYFRPRIHRGNFPFTPQSSSLASIGLLAAVGRWAEEAEYRIWAEKILDSLVDVPIYLITYDNMKATAHIPYVVRYDHYIVELAKENELDKIIYGLEQTRLYGEERKNLDSPNYQRFSLFSSRFLQLFNPPSFRDFLAFRAEYEPEMLILLQTYFGDVMNIPSEIVNSARVLGNWLNFAAFIAAKKEMKNPEILDKKEDSKEKNEAWENVSKYKAKFLVELESSIFSAKNETALFSQVITRAGRLSGTEVPQEASVFMEAVAEGKLGIGNTKNLENAQNLLIAFSRIRSNGFNYSKG